MERKTKTMGKGAMFYGFVLLGTFLTVPQLFASPGSDAYQRGDYQGAEKYFGDKAMQAPDDYQDAYNWGNSLYQLRQYDGASNAYEKAVKIKPNLQEGWYNLGNSYLKQDRYRDAIGAYGQALKLKPNDGDSKYGLELARQKLQKKPEGDKSLNPEGNKEAQQAAGQAQEGKSAKGGDGKNGNKKGGGKNPSASTAKSQGGKPGPGNGPGGPPNGGQGAGNQDQAIKDLARQGLSDKQIKNLMAQLQRQEERAQRYYSADPRGEEKKRDKVWNFGSHQMREFMQDFLGKGKKDGVAEDW